MILRDKESTSPVPAASALRERHTTPCFVPLGNTTQRSRRFQVNYDQSTIAGLGKKHAPGKVADSLVMPDSSPEGLTQASGIRVGSIMIYPEPPYQRLVVQSEGRTLRGEAALPVLFEALMDIQASAKANGQDVASAIAANVDLV